MRYSTLNETAVSRTMQQEFRGYNHNLRIPETDFYDTQNMTGDDYPILSVRKRRGEHDYPYTTEDDHAPYGLISKDALCYVDGTGFYVNNYKIPNIVLSEGQKQLISMGAYVIIMPDKKYVNTKDFTDAGDIEATFVTSSTVTYEMCRVDGEVYGGVIISPTEPADPANSQMWIDTSQTPHVLKQYSATSSMWVQVLSTYVKISATNIAAGFKQWDGVKISGIDSSIEQLKDFNDQISVIYDCHHTELLGDTDYIVIAGILDETATQDTALTISRKMPNMDFVIESNNRLWGCRYGTNANGDIVNEIYASKLGDFKNWNVFLGLTTDSYTASCGTDGAFTGAITHLGYPLFFKENCLHKVYGNYPSNYQVQQTTCRGVVKGAGRSLAIVNETLFYKSRNGVCAYDGSLPQEIADAFGEEKYNGVDALNTDALRNGAVAGAHDNKYYISMISEAGENVLFVFDTKLGAWYKVDDTRAECFCSHDGKMYFIEDERIMVVDSDDPDEDPVEWGIMTGQYGLDMPDTKYISKLVVRMSMEIGSRAIFYIQYDDNRGMEHIATITGTSLRSFELPIKPKRCDHFRLIINGTGDAKIYSITKTVEQGGEI